MIKGIILMLLASLAFSGGSVFAKMAMTGTDVTGLQVVFFRFLIGLVVTAIYMVSKRISFRPNNIKYVSMRAVTNSAAAILLFTGIQLTTVTNANMLNMTYPVFVFVIAPFLNREENRPVHYLYLVLTIAGAFMVINPSMQGVNTGDIIALLSGIVAGFAISSLREARKYDHSMLILFYLMLLGTPVSLALAAPVFVVSPGAGVWWLILAAASSVVAGQIFLTVGFRYVSAAAGSLVTATRIPMAAALGITFLGDPLNATIIAGGLLILVSLVGVSLSGSQSSQRQR
jgi:drug/metabolite transporter (DMT)-like permease